MGRRTDDPVALHAITHVVHNALIGVDAAVSVTVSETDRSQTWSVVFWALSRKPGIMMRPS